MKFLSRGLFFIAIIICVNARCSSNQECGTCKSDGCSWNPIQDECKARNWCENKEQNQCNNAPACVWSSSQCIDNINYQCPGCEGKIEMFYGNINNIQHGWQICDGSNGTPDLRNRFLISAGSEFPYGSNGGASSLYLNIDEIPEHNHDLDNASTSHNGTHYHRVNGETQNNGNHTHNIDEISTNGDGDHDHYVYAYFKSDSGTTKEIVDVRIDTVDADNEYPITTTEVNEHTHIVPETTTNNAGQHNHAFDLLTDSNGQHNHQIVGKTSNVGSGKEINIMPPYFSVYFICCSSNK